MTRFRWLLHQLGIHALCRVRSEWRPSASREFIRTHDGDDPEVTNQDDGYYVVSHS